MAEKNPLARAICERHGRNIARRQIYMNTWDQISQYCIPRRSYFTDKTANNPKFYKERMILDSTAPRSLEQFASFLHTSLSNPTQRWFYIDLDLQPGQEPSVDVKKWREIAEQAMADSLSLSQDSLYGNLHEAYIDLGAFGTACLFTDERPGGGVRTRYFGLEDLAIEEGENGLIDFVQRKECLDARQARQRWPEASLGRQIDEAKGEQSQQKYNFIHTVFPRTEQELYDLLPEGIRATNAPYYSVWVLIEDEIVVSTKSYQEFPYTIARWLKVSGETYGRSPAMTALGDILMVNRMAETVLRGAEKLVDPPLQIRDGGLVSPVRLHPGGISYTDGDAKIEPLLPAGASRIELGAAMIKDRQEAIREAFFVPLFFSADSPVYTATQTLQIADERNRQVGPMLLRLQNELFTPLITRVYGVLRRQGIIPEPPPELATRRFKIGYVSPIITSQKQADAASTQRLFETLAPWAQIDPGVFDHYDPDKLSQTLHAASGAPASILRNEAAVKRLRDARMQQRQREQLQQVLPQAVEAGAKLTQAQAAMTKANK